MRSEATRHRAAPSPAAALAAGVLVAASLLAGAAPASAEAPSRLPGQVTDTAGALGADTSPVDSRLEELRTSDGVQLWVVYVRGFDGMSAADWSARTRSLSDLGASDALLTVAVEERAYHFTYDSPDRDTAGDEKLARQIADSDIEPALGRSDWAGAATAAADGIHSARAGGTGGSGGGAVWLLLALLAAVAVGVAVLLGSRRRRRAQIASAHELAGDDTASLSRLPTDVLDARARAGLVDADQAVAASASALEVATGEFGELRTRPFTEALAAAREQLTGAHGLLHRLDGAAPPSDAERRSVLLEVAAAGERVERALGEQSEAFTRLRDVLVHGAETVDALTRRAVTCRARVPGCETTLAGLRERFGEPQLASVADNTTLATRLVEEAEGQIARAREALSRPVGEQAEAVDAVTAAEGGLARAETLLDAVDHAAEDIATARSGLAALVAEVRGELGDAERLGADPDVTPPTREALERAAQEARAAVEAAERDGDTDPLGTYSTLVAADRALDGALAAAGAEDASA